MKNLTPEIQKLKNRIFVLINTYKDDDYFTGNDESNTVWDDMKKFGIADCEDKEHCEYLLKCDPIEVLEYALKLVLDYIYSK